ncbi:uncharacterized protein LOC112569337 isoform X1 [Pomacea canaliculata]|uniref:uncharacterized protein LOC112569337 isoform X1 n=1 Tax=Pomacea canaliculata TaxID=400727 RepID=UPI000D72963E|nr:uncharacterized protein LOC112569337 isoform X1 [Pomacea canaliculata]XP_025102900.1 uncharacterized protein LOC112569337 isoform X2 [Pomacea canaliculata]XP_025102901.1 uncharacterized protein LOC112569337 isoform X1 [Pomacea canaliculata]
MYSDGDVFSSDTLQLQVYYRPVIRITRSDNQGQPLSTYTEVIKGHNVTFVCDADSNPPPASITWSGKVNSTTGELHIIAAQQTTHDGIYTCTVVTETADDDERLPLRASSQITLIVKVFFQGPSFLESQETKQLTQSYHIHRTTQFSSFPQKKK